MPDIKEGVERGNLDNLEKFGNQINIRFLNNNPWSYKRMPNALKLSRESDFQPGVLCRNNLSI